MQSPFWRTKAVVADGGLFAVGILVDGDTEVLPIIRTGCVGYKVPLFLGGADVLANLEVIDLSVYVEICGQLRNEARTTD